MSDDQPATTSEERPLGNLRRDENPGDIILEPDVWVEDVRVVEE